MTHALLFEINGIQSYLFASGRLREVIGASEMLDLLTNKSASDNLFCAVCRQIPGGEDIECSRRAGGAFYIFCARREPLEAFMGLWTLAVQHWVPEILYDIALGEGANHLEAFEDARQKLQVDRSRNRIRLPAASPITERNRRRGLAAEFVHKNDGLIDATTARRKVFSDLSCAGFIQRFSPPESKLGWRDWPTNMDSAEKENDKDNSFPFSGENRTVALIHADGNGLGQVLLNANQAVRANPSRFIELYEEISKMVENSTIEAAHEATRRVLLPAREKEGSAALAARPVLLGGEDVIVIVRGDLALDYMEVFAEAFDRESRNQLAEMNKLDIDGLPRRLTIGFGAVFLRASQPFHMGIALAEELMGEGKKAAKVKNAGDPPATLQFQRVTASLVDDYNASLERQFTHRYGDTVYVDSLGVYYLDDIAPRLADLRALTSLLRGADMARGPTRQLMTLIGLAPEEARARYRRWRQLMAENAKVRLKEFDRLMRTLLGLDVWPNDPPDLPYGPPREGVRKTPLGDAIALIGVVHGVAPSSKEDAA